MDTHAFDPGFYRHYKHDPSGEENNYTYEVLGIGRNTEEKTYTVIYRPLYENGWMVPAHYQSRPFEMFMENVEKDGKTMPRFTKIIDPALIEKLKVVRNQMYPTHQALL